MAEISLLSVFDAVTLALHTAFPNSRIHGHTVTQSLLDGDIQIIGFVSASSGEPVGRESVTSSLTVAYYPSKEGGLAECVNAGERIKRTLLKVKTPEGDILHGLSPSLDCGDGDSPVIFTVKYTYFAREKDSNEPIGEFKINFGGING